jgi:hypothetical protein
VTCRVSALVFVLLVSAAAEGYCFEQWSPEPSSMALTKAVAPPPLTLEPIDTAVFYAKPFHANGPWNRPIDPTATIQAVPGLAQLDVGTSNWLQPDEVSIPVYRATMTDGLTKILYNPLAWTMLAAGSWKSADNAPETEAAIRAGSRPDFPLPYHPYVSQSADSFVLAPGYNSIRNPANGSVFTFQAPDGLRPSGNADGHMAVFQPDGLVVETYATIVLSDNTVVCLSYMVTDSMKAGDGVQNGVTASMIPVYAGLIRRDELAAGKIDHAIKVVVPAEMLAPAYIYPAYAFDRGAMAETPPYSGTLPMGARLAIPAAVDLARLKLRTRIGKVVAQAAQRYGFVVTDRGGSGITLILEAGMPSTYAWNRDVEEDLRSILWETVRVSPP